MLPKRIILEGKSYLMLEENLGRLQYNSFKQGSINAKHYSDYEAITPVGIASIDTITKKTIDKKKVEVEDLKFAIKFKWNVDVLASNPDLFLRYYNYFEAAPQTQDGKKAGVASSTVTDFMPFLNDSVYSKTFNKILAEEGNEESEEYLSEAKEDKEDLEANLNSFDDAFTDIEPGDEFGNDVGTADEKDILTGGSKDISRKKGKEYFFYLVFKYDENYDHSAKLKSAAFTDGANIEIIKLVSEDHVGDSNVAITGRILEKKAVGFYRELLGILNANHKSIMKVVNEEEKELGLDLSEIPSENKELNFDTGVNDASEESPIGDENGIPEQDKSPSEKLNPSYITSEDAKVNARREQIGNSPSTNPGFDPTSEKDYPERFRSLNRLKAHGNLTGDTLI